MQKSDVASKKLDPFQIADNIFMKTGILDPAEVGYDAFMMARICSNNLDTVFFANELNRFPNCSKQMSYRFYYEAIEKGKRYGKWRKSPKDDEIACIVKAYGVNKRKASQYHKILGPEGVQKVIASQFQGGKQGPAKKRDK